MNELSKKLDSRAQIQLAIGELPENVDLLLRLDDELTVAQRQQLEKAGCTVQNSQGKVIMGRSRRASLDRIAEQEFVRQIEVSRATHPERPESSGSSIE